MWDGLGGVVRLDKVFVVNSSGLVPGYAHHDADIFEHHASTSIAGVSVSKLPIKVQQQSPYYFYRSLSRMLSFFTRERVQIFMFCALDL